MTNITRTDSMTNITRTDSDKFISLPTTGTIPAIDISKDGVEWVAAFPHSERWDDMMANRPIGFGFDTPEEAQAWLMGEDGVSTHDLEAQILLHNLNAVDVAVDHAETALDNLRAKRSTLVSELEAHGVTRYRMAKATRRSVSTVDRW